MDATPTLKEKSVPDTVAEPPSKPRFPFVLLFLIWGLIVFTAVLVTAASPESFASSTRIKIRGDYADTAPLTEVAGKKMEAYDPYFLQTEFETIQSEVVLGPVIQELSLNREWGRKYGDGNPLKTSETLALLKGRVDLRPVRNTSILEIKAYSEKPGEAANLANAIARAYQMVRQQARLDRISSEVLQLKEANRENAERIKTLRAQIDGFSRDQTNASRLEQATGRLDELLRLEQMIDAKIASESTDFRLPATRMVEIVDRAVPWNRPVRPNVPLNIASGVVIGGMAGLMLATVIYGLQFRTYWHRTNPARTPFPARLRAVAHGVIAFVVGVIIGYCCATPLDPVSILVMFLSLILGGLASAWIELANAGPPVAAIKGRRALDRW